MDGLILDTENLYTLGTQTILQEYGKVVQEKSSTFIFPGSSYRFISFRFVSIRFDSIRFDSIRFDSIRFDSKRLGIVMND